MKSMKRHIYLAAIVLTLTMFVAACGNEEPTEPTQTEQSGQTTEPVTPTTGTLVMELGGNVCTPEKPATATNGSPVEITIQQRCSYQDPNGSTYTCEPKASIALTVQSDTVRAKTLAELLAITELTENSTTGTNPLTRRVHQSFSIGEQQVEFALAHEIYTYEASTHKEVEMPYVKLQPASHGKAQSESQTRVAAGVTAAVTGIRLKRMPTTRTYITTEEAYEVSVAFTVEAEAIHTEVAQRQTLSFEVQYVGIVETTTEYPDPVTALTYHADVLEGTDSSSSPYAMKGNAREMALQWQQQSSYTWYDIEQMATQVVNKTPSAHVRVSLGTERPRIILNDDGKLIVEDLSSLPKVDHTTDLKACVASEVQTSTEGRITMSRRNFTVAGVVLTVEWDYEVCEDMQIDGTTVAMPYLMPGEAQVVDVSTREANELYWYVQQYEGNVKKNIYEVTVRIQQPMTKCNAADTGRDVAEYEVTFVVLQTAALVEVAFRREVKWASSHDNILATHTDYVYRDRIYADGEKRTDTFFLGGMGLGGIMIAINSRVESERYYYHWPDIHEDSHYLYEYARVLADYIGLVPSNPWDSEYETVNDSTYILRAYMGIPDFEKLHDGEVAMDNEWNLYPDEWKTYLYAAKAPEGTELDLNGVKVVGANGTTDKPNGAYLCGGIMGGFKHSWRWTYDSGLPAFETEIPHYGSLSGNYYIEHELDLPCSATAWVLDGQVVTFEDMVGEYQFDNRTEYLQATEERGPAKVITSEGMVNFLGKNFYLAVVDTIYQIKDSGRPYEMKRRSSLPSGKRTSRSFAPEWKQKKPTIKADVIVGDGGTINHALPRKK